MNESDYESETGEIEENLNESDYELETSEQERKLEQYNNRKQRLIDDIKTSTERKKELSNTIKVYKETTDDFSSQGNDWGAGIFNDLVIKYKAILDKEIAEFFRLINEKKTFPVRESAYPFTLRD
jgi:chromosome segregation ATPase